MANTALNVTRTDASTNETLNQTLTDLNPAATNAQLKAFAQAFYGLSDDTYVDATRVDKTDVDTEESGGGKSFRQIAVTGATQNATATITFNKASDESVTPIAFYYTASATTKLTLTAGTGTDTQAVFTTQIPDSTGTLFIGISEKDAFYSECYKAAVS